MARSMQYRIHRCIFWWVACSFYLSLLSSAYGQKSQSYIDEMKALIKQGQALADTQKYEQAQVKMEAALGLYKTRLKNVSLSPTQTNYLQKTVPTLHYFIGRLYLYQKRYIRAFEACARAHQQKIPPAYTIKLRRCVQHSREKIVAVVKIHSHPSSAVVKIYHSRKLTYAGKTPYTLRLLPGAVDLYLSLPGHRAKKHHFVLLPGKPLSLNFRLSKSPLLIDKKPAPQGVLRKQATVLFWSGLGTGVVAVGVGVTLTVLAQQEFANAEQIRIQKDATQEKFNAHFEQATLMQGTGIALFAVGGAILIGASALYIWERSTRKRTVVRAPSGSNQQQSQEKIQLFHRTIF